MLTIRHNLVNKMLNAFESLLNRSMLSAWISCLVRLLNREDDMCFCSLGAGYPHWRLYNSFLPIRCWVSHIEGCMYLCFCSLGAGCPTLKVSEGDNLSPANVRIAYYGALMSFHCPARATLLGPEELWCDGTQWSPTDVSPMCTSEYKSLSLSEYTLSQCWFNVGPMSQTEWCKKLGMPKYCSVLHTHV